MTSFSRRYMLASFTITPLVAACTPTQQDAFIARIKSLSQTLTNTLTKYAGSLLPDIVKEVTDNNTAIQKAATLAQLAKEVLPAFLRAAEKIVGLIPGGIIPASALAALRTILGFLSGTIGGASAATGMSVDEAELILISELKR